MHNELIERIKAETLCRTRFIVSDCNTFLWVRSEMQDALEKRGLGGGNFLMAMGLFAVLNFLGKVYKLLREDAGIKEEEVSELKQFLKKHPEYRRLVEPKRIGQLNEAECFRELLLDAPSRFGLSREEIDKVWRWFRNKLAHLSAPSAGNIILAILDPSAKDYRRLKDIVNNSDAPVFRPRDDGFECHVDLLNGDILRIADWLCSQVNERAFNPDRIEATLKWIELEQDSNS